MKEISIKHKHVLENDRPTIAALIGSMSSEYHDGIVRGAAYVAAERGYNFIGFSGGPVNTPAPFSLARDKVFDFVDLNRVSGILSPFSSLVRYLDEKETYKFINQFAAIPIVNIGSTIEGRTNILTEYESGFREIFEHFYHIHGYRKILLMRGPEHHASSQQRAAIYRALCDEYKLPYSDDLVIYSDLNRDSAKKSMESFLRKRSCTFDAIIALNDFQALGIIDILSEKGIRVPEDVAVVGSMNSLEGSFSTPSLTSIKEPSFELGQAAAIELIEQIEGKKPLKEIIKKTSLVIRQSCGCVSSEQLHLEQLSSDLQLEISDSFESVILEELRRDTEQIAAEYKGGILKNDLFRILDIFRDSLFRKDHTYFLEELKSRLEKSQKSEDIMLWLAIMAKLQIFLLRIFDRDPSSRLLILLSMELIKLRNDYGLIAINYRRYETDFYLNNFRAIENNLNKTFNLTSLKPYIVEILYASEFYISIFHNDEDQNKMASNLFSVHNGHFIELDLKEYNAINLLPDNIEAFKDPYSLIVFPLSFRNKQIGHMTVSLSDRKGIAYENLRATISSALKNEILIQDLKSAEERFSDIAHSTSNWLWETDVNNEFTYCSDSSSEIIGYPPQTLVGKKINELNVENCDGYIKSMIDKEDLSGTECWSRHENGKVVCLTISAKPIITDGAFCGYRGVFENITEQKLQEEKIRNLAYLDVLTGLPNRASFQDKLEETISFSARDNKKFALIFIDLDHFKRINDSMGHAVGDILLIKLAERLKRSIRSRDFLARLGGDEFTIILPDIENQMVIIEVANRILENVQSPIQINGKPVYNTLSLGISLYPNDGLNADILLQRGDSAMYQVKSQGRNGFVFYDMELERKNALRNRYEEILREAIAENGFIIHYQPQVSLKSNSVVGFEALVRINDPKEGVIYPGNFIPLAEELGLIGQVDEMVFSEVCRQYAHWSNLALNNIRLSINLSAIQLRDDKVLSNYVDIMKRFNVNPGDIQLEITENALIENEDVALTILNGFKRFGISIALDDFGTGYSSLSCINLYPIDTIKIDRSFVVNAVDNPVNKAVIQGIVSIASSLNLKIIAEGVENQEQYEFIRDLGCHEIQGYYFYKPCTVEKTRELLESEHMSDSDNEPLSQTRIQ